MIEQCLPKIKWQRFCQYCFMHCPAENRGKYGFALWDEDCSGPLYSLGDPFPGLDVAGFPKAYVNTCTQQAEDSSLHITYQIIKRTAMQNKWSQIQYW